MNVASLELCRELYELSGWGYTEKSEHVITADGYDEYDLPLYDLGYLLRQMPKEIDNVWLTLRPIWYAGYDHMTADEPVKAKYDALADTPEDAACKLCIELFKQGVLVRGSEK